MNGFDIAALGLLIAALGLGLAVGIVRVSLGGLSLVVGAVASIAFAEPAGAFLGTWLASPQLAMICGFLGTFAAVLILFALLVWLIRESLKKLGLGWIDRVLGAALGLALALPVAAGAAYGLRESAPRSSLVLSSVTLPTLAHGMELGVAELPPEWRRRINRIFRSPASILPDDGEAPTARATPPPASGNIE